MRAALRCINTVLLSNHYSGKKMRKSFIGIISMLLLSSFIAGDSDFIDSLSAKLNLYNEHFKRVKLDLFFNQPKYSPGDTAYFRTSYLSASDLKPVTGNQIVDIILFDEKGSKKFKSQVLVNNGYGDNQFVIPDKLSPGIYRLVAYSNWMRNLDSELFFQRDFIVTGEELLEAKKTKIDSVKVYPEGGHLINEIENRLVVLGENNKEVIISTSSGEEIAKSILNDKGFATIKIIPKTGERYIAYYASSITNNPNRVPLPVSDESGFAIQVTDSVDAAIVQSHDMKNKKGPWYAVISNCKGIFFSKLLVNVNGDESIRIPFPEMRAGVYLLSIMDENSKIWAERLFYSRPKNNIHVDISNSKEFYSVRDNGSITLKVVDENNTPVRGDLSVRIIKHDLFEDKSDSKGLIYNLLLGSDIGAWYDVDYQNQYEVNQLLISRPCYWLDWNKVTTSDYGAQPYRPKSTLSYSGVAFNENLKPVTDSTLIMLFLQRNIIGYEVYTKNGGRFNLPLVYNMWGEDDIFYAALYKGNDLRGVTLKFDNPDSSVCIMGKEWKPTTLEDKYGKFTLNKKIIDKSFLFYANQASSKDSVVNPNAIIEDELMGADVVVELSDYVVFPTMTDVVKEVLRSVDHRKIKGRDIIHVYTTLNRKNSFAEPLYVIDGVLTKNTEAFLKLNPAEVSTIKVVKDSKKLTRLGSLGMYGVILVNTKYAGVRENSLQENSIHINGLNYKGKILGNSLNKEKNVPDLRSCLYWNPKISLSAEGEAQFSFATSDDVGTYDIEIVGLTTEGRPFFATSSVQIKFTE